MKLDVNVLRYLSKDDWRVLTSVEMGEKNHEIVPLPLIDSISGLKHGGAFKCLKTLLRHKLVHHDGAKYDGYRLTNMGYDFLAIKTLCNRGHISGVGRQIGVGKESDIFEVMNDEGETFALKLHRLGRTSFRAVKSKRDYLGKRGNHFSWLYLSRLAALKEYAFMKALGDHGFPVPQAIDNNRHAVLMTLIEGSHQLVHIRKLQNPAQVYLTCMELISRLAGKGLIHCDFNEFNLLISDTEELTMIDFPQMVSVSHANAKELFERDVECVVRFFHKKIGYMPEQDKSLPYVKPSFETAIADIDEALDVDLAASGFKKEHQLELDEFEALREEAQTVEGEQQEPSLKLRSQEEAYNESGGDAHYSLVGSEATREVLEDGTSAGFGIETTVDGHVEGHYTSSGGDEGCAGEEPPSSAREDDENHENDSETEPPFEREGGDDLEEASSVLNSRRSVGTSARASIDTRQVQHIVVQQRKNQQRREVLARAAGSRNKSKANSGKGRAGGGGASDVPSFGGW
ncbi:hypothetical protein CEUSTIGMA_g798.t1 [Chlamydomonas eustigma]|uniref:Serine/threonine-protein kinase RIO2 n=1 Tax=Chlamydomonas eustigma TaxID=1157962 RepID=A0A250WR74_9CHLO|nr:hypothetical protein CEUSTIGMA_g798.t1 [Chlamydomonas eustigma]|eukprot:GAX73345.1 hypothetical protein CEUSTIGMA_g798.t1 [Chlamydomonas eustigma]